MKKRKKLRKLAADDGEEPAAARSQKRKTPTRDSDHEGSPSKDREPKPPKKRKKRDVSPKPPPQEAAPIEGVDNPVVNKASEKPQKKSGQPKSKKDKSTLQANADPKPLAGTTVLDEDQSEKSKKKPKKDGNAERKAVDDNSTPQGDGGELQEAATATGTTITDKPKPKARLKPKTKDTGQTSSGQNVRDKVSSVPKPMANDEESDPKEGPNPKKDKGKSPAKAPADTEKDDQTTEKQTKGTGDSTAGQAAISATDKDKSKKLDKLSPAKDEKAAGDKPKKATEKAVTEKPTGVKANTENNQTKPQDELQAPSKKQSELTVCPICAKTPWHTQSRCSIYRTGLPANLTLLERLKKAHAEDPTDGFRTHQIQLIEKIVAKKQTKSGQKNKVVSDVANVVAGVTSSSSAETSKKSGQPSKSKGPEIAHTLEHASHKSSSSLAQENSPNTSVSQTPPSGRRTSETSSRKPSNEALTTQPAPSMSRPPAIQQSKEVPKTNTGANNRPSPLQAPSNIPVESPSSSSESSNEAPTPRPPDYQTRISRPPLLSQTQPKSSLSKSNPGKGDSTSDDSSVNESPSHLPPPPGSNVLTNLSSLADADLDAVIRGPNSLITSKNLPSSDSSGDEESEEDKEDLVRDSEEESPPRSKVVKAVYLSSGEEESDDSDQESEKSGEHQDNGGQPPQLRVDTRLSNDDSSPSTTVEYGNLSFGAANDLASSIEIDSRGDRAFSEALADDTAVFKLAKAEPEESGGGESDEGPATPKKKQQSNRVNTQVASSNDRCDSIEPFESPEKPRSPIVEQDLLHSTPRGLTQRMKDRQGKTPAPAPKDEKATKLYDSVRKLINASSRSTTTKTPTQAQKPDTSTAADKHSSRTPATVKMPPPRTTRNKAKHQSQGSSITLNMEETPASFNRWEALQPEYSSQNEMDMEDELRSDPLFIPSETQYSFPYSQWQDKQQDGSPNDSEDEDEVENAIITRQPTASQKRTSAYKGLSQIASQKKSFRTGASAAPKPKGKKDTVAELFGQIGEEESDESGLDSDSDSDNEKPEQMSHIPKSRRAGVRTKA